MIQKKKRKAVSPIVSVILMVALSILLASLVSGFAFDLIDQILQSPAQAGLQFSESYNPEEGTYDVEIVWGSEGTVETVHAIKPDGSSTPRMTGVGESITVEGVEENDDIRVIGTMEDGSEQIVQSYTVGT
jgi:FlaG/FlaF family flagellin (archaellin)